MFITKMQQSNVISLYKFIHDEGSIKQRRKKTHYDTSLKTHASGYIPVAESLGISSTTFMQCAAKAMPNSVK